MPISPSGSTVPYLRGKTALITGSTSGIGLGIAHALAQAGASIWLNGFADQATIDRLLASFQQQYGVEAAYSPADMRKPDEIASMMQQAIARHGSVDILVNNAGIQHVHPVESFPDQDWNDILAIDLSASFHTIKHAFAAMKRQAWGRIINIRSAHGLVASPFKAAYVSAKHGLIGLSKVVALEGAEHGITCNAICPGYVNTPLVRKQIPEQAAAHHMPEAQVIREVILQVHARKAFVEVEEIGALAVFLCQDAAQSITGSVLPIDCGWSAH